MAILINNKTGSTVGPYDGGVTIAGNTSYSVPDISVPHFAKDVNLLSDTLNNLVTITLGSTEIGGIGAFNILNELAATATINKIGQISAGYINFIGGLDGSGNAANINIDRYGQLKTALVGNDGLYTAYVDSVGRVATNANVTFPETIYEKTALLNTGSKAANVSGSIDIPISFKHVPVTNVHYLEQVSIVIEDQGDFLSSNLGALSSLTNGIQINVKSKGQIFTLGTIKDNADIYGIFTEAPAQQSIAVALQSNINTYWAGWRLQNRITLDPTLGDYIEVSIRDNLTGLIALNFFVSVWKTLG